MTNDESLSLVAAAIADCEAELIKLDSLSTAAAASQQGIAKLESDIVELHFNTASLPPKGRAAALTNAQAYLELERADWALLTGKIELQSNRVVAFGERAKSLLRQVWSAVLEARKAGVEASLRANFDFRQNYMLATELTAHAFCVTEVAVLQGTLFQYRYLPTERDLAIDDVRKLRNRSAGLLTMAANELGQQEFAIVPIELGPIAEPKPAVVGNQLGTLAQAIAA